MVEVMAVPCVMQSCRAVGAFCLTQCRLEPASEAPVSLLRRFEALC